MSLLKKLKEYRLQNNLSMEEMGKIIGVKRLHYSRIENELVPLTEKNKKILEEYLNQGEKKNDIKIY